MNYTYPYILRENLGNNSFSYHERSKLSGSEPILTIPKLIEGTLDDVEIGEDIVFEELENERLLSCKGLRHYVRIKESGVPITIFDNHNHALYFWLEAIRVGKIQPGCELIHIDEHSDLWENENNLNHEEAIKNPDYAWEFTNFSCNVGNYIQPALRSGLISTMIRIENEFQIDAYMDYSPRKNSILNIDLDFFAPEIDFIDKKKKIQLIKNLIPQVGCITIATSPFFIEQKRAIMALHELFI